MNTLNRLINRDNDYFAAFSEFDSYFEPEKTGPLLTGLAAGEPIKSAEDRRLDWLRQRWGLFTASEFHRLMGYEDKPGLPNGAITYAKQKAVELLTEFSADVYLSPAMQWGIDHEHAAIDNFTAATGLEVSDCKDGQNFIALNDAVGGTPDGIIHELSAGIEIKCPQSVTHLDYLENITDAMSLKKAAPDYYWQIQGLMMITGLESWFFVSFDPRFLDEKLRLHIASIEKAPEDIDKLEQRLDLAIEYRGQVLAKKLGADPGALVRIPVAKCRKTYAGIQAQMAGLLRRIEHLEQTLAAVPAAIPPSQAVKYSEWRSRIEACQTISDITRLLHDIPKDARRYWMEEIKKQQQAIKEKTNG
jgi:hypothetical protein